MARSLTVWSGRFLAALLITIVFAGTGCDSGPKVYPVKGTVINKGKGSVKDLTGYNVQFQSLTDPTELPGGSIEADGTFTLHIYSHRWESSAE